MKQDLRLSIALADFSILANGYDLALLEVGMLPKISLHTCIDPVIAVNSENWEKRLNMSKVTKYFYVATLYTKSVYFL